MRAVRSILDEKATWMSPSANEGGCEGSPHDVDDRSSESSQTQQKEEIFEKNSWNNKSTSFFIN